MQYYEDQLYALISEIFPLSEDLKVEVIAALFYQQIDCKFSIRPLGPARRPHKKDLDNVTLEAIEGSDDPLLVYKVNRYGLYDLLPQMLFHKASTNNQLPDSDSFERQVKYNSEQEIKARGFFQPIESCLNDIRTLLMVQEIALLKNQFLEYESSHFMVDFWDFDPSFTAEDKSILVHILPFLVNNKNQVESINFCLSRLCGNEMHLHYHMGRLIQFKQEEEELSLVDAILGSNTVLGSSYFDENAIWVDLKVHLNSIDEYSDYLEDTRQRKLINFVMSYILPMEMEFELSFEAPNETEIKNSMDENAPNGVLGINSVLEDIVL